MFRLFWRYWGVREHLSRAERDRLRLADTWDAAYLAGRLDEHHHLHFRPNPYGDQP